MGSQCFDEQDIGEPRNDSLRPGKTCSRFALQKIENGSYPRIDAGPATLKMNDLRQYRQKRVGLTLLEIEAAA